jgi:hypothetical protein
MLVARDNRKKLMKDLSKSQLKIFRADISARNTLFEQIYFFFKCCAKNQILAKDGS